MTITYHSGERLQGTSTDFETNGTGIPAVSGGWKELGRTTLGSAGDIISVTGLADKRYYMLLNYVIGNGDHSNDLRLNNDSGSNYSRRKQYNGGSEEVVTNQTHTNVGGWDRPTLDVHYLSNLASKEKLNIWQSVMNSASGSGTAPSRLVGVAKWTNTSDAINRIDVVNNASGDFATGSECVVLGWDESDTHTDNFWEELASVELGSANANISSGTITAKKISMGSNIRKRNKCKRY